MVNLKNCSIEEFIKYSEGKKVYSFGVSELIRIFCERNKKYNFEKLIFSFTDNDSNKWGNDYIVNERAITVISVNNFINDIGKDDIILISTYYYPDIIEQLDKIEALGQTTCFILPYIDEYCDNIDPELKEKIALSKEKKQQIPGKIYYGWFGGSEIPDKLKICMESWNKYCPDYEILQIDENTYDIAKNKYVKSAYEAKKWSRVNNYARLDIIYENGGIYLDTDVELIKPLDDLLFHKAFVGFSCKYQIEFGSGFGAKKHFKLFQSLLSCWDGNEQYSDEYNLQIVNKRYALLYSQGFLPDNSFQNINGLTIYPNDFFTPLSPNTGALKITENTYSIHRFALSWNEKSKAAYNKILEFQDKNSNRITKLKRESDNG